METSLLPLLVMLLVVFFVLRESRRIRAAAVHHRSGRTDRKREMEQMKALAERFVGKDCLVYTLASSTDVVKGVLVEVSDGGLLMNCNGNPQAVNLEFVTRIQEWPKNAKGKKKSVIL